MGKKMKKKSMKLLENIKTELYVMYSMNATSLAYEQYKQIHRHIDEIIAQEKDMTK